MFIIGNPLSSTEDPLGEKGKVVALVTRQDLAKIKLKALRMRIWFRALSKIERAIVDLTIKCVEKIRSNVLTETIAMIVDKISYYLEENFVAKAEQVGRSIAEALSAFGVRWGNEECSAWKNDRCFVRFIGVMALN